MNFNYFLDNQYLKESIDFNIDNELVKEVLVKACKKKILKLMPVAVQFLKAN